MEHEHLRPPPWDMGVASMAAGFWLKGEGLLTPSLGQVHSFGSSSSPRHGSAPTCLTRAEVLVPARRGPAGSGRVGEPGRGVVGVSHHWGPACRD